MTRPTDFRALCAELLDEIPHESSLTRMARAALAEPEADGPAVPESRKPASVAPEATEQAQPLWKVMRTAYDCSTAPNGSTGDWTERDGFAAEGDVGELVAELRSTASGLESQSYPQTAALITRAADLLERRHPTPVPAATGTTYEFCVYDENYIDQAGGTAPTYAQALSEGQHYLAQYLQDGPHTLELRRIELLPLPDEEAKE